jgi:hypothetical protein
MNRVLILAEGQTEERFVKDILQPHLWPLGVDPQPKIATTKRVKDGADFKGGVIKFKKVEDNLRRLLGDTGARRKNSNLIFRLKTIERAIERVTRDRSAMSSVHGKRAQPG